MKDSFKKNLYILWYSEYSYFVKKKKRKGDRQWTNQNKTKETPLQKCVRHKSGNLKYISSLPPCITSKETCYKSVSTIGTLKKKWLY